MTAEGLDGTLHTNIVALAEREREERRHASLSERIALRITGFAGSMTFVWLHAAIFGGWIAINLGWVSGLPPFDPTFVALAMVASVEAIFLSTFVLIGQNRMALLDERRASLDLHISLLTEHELTRLAALIDSMAKRLEVPVDEGEMSEVERDVQPVDVMDAIEENRQKDIS